MNNTTSFPTDIASAVERARMLNSVGIDGWVDATYDALDLTVEAANYGEVVLSEKVATLDARRYQPMSEVEAMLFPQQVLVALVALVQSPTLATNV